MNTEAFMFSVDLSILVYSLWLIFSGLTVLGMDTFYINTNSWHRSLVLFIERSIPRGRLNYFKSLALAPLSLIVAIFLYIGQLVTRFFPKEQESWNDIFTPKLFMGVTTPFLLPFLKILCYSLSVPVYVALFFGGVMLLSP